MIILGMKFRVCGYYEECTKIEFFGEFEDKMENNLGG
jgi:hypothetical protein